MGCLLSCFKTDDIYEVHFSKKREYNIIKDSTEDFMNEKYKADFDYYDDLNRPTEFSRLLYFRTNNIRHGWD
jgi:hypothetical protein